MQDPSYHPSDDHATPFVECAAEDGVCFCPTCGAVVRVVPRVRQVPTVVDVDGRAHLCERFIAGVMDRHGVAGMRSIVDQHSSRPVIAEPYKRRRQPPTSAPHSTEIPDVE